MTGRGAIGIALLGFMLGTAVAGASPAATRTANTSAPSLKLRVKWDGRYIPGVNRVSPLFRDTEIVSDPATDRKSPGRTEYDDITLERGVGRDTSFEDWANQVPPNGANANDTSHASYRKNVTLEFYNDDARRVMAYNLYGCWPSEYAAVPDIDANGNAAAIEHIKIECESWARDKSVVEPVPTR